MYSMNRSLSCPQYSSHPSFTHRGTSPDRQHASSRIDTGVQVGRGSLWERRWPRNLVAAACIPVCISLFGLVGCGGVVNLSPSSTKLTSTPSAIDFGTVNVGSSANQKVTITNTGLGSVQITNLNLSNTAFSVDGEGNLPVTLEAGKNLNLNVHYSPTDSVNSAGNMDVLVGTSSTPAATVKLNGKGTKPSGGEPAVLSGISCSSTQITGAGTDACLVTTNIAAPANGLVVNLASSDSAVTVPGTITVPSGAKSATFAANASSIKSKQTAVITATQGSVAKSFSIALMPTTTPSSVPVVSSFSCGVSSFTGTGSTSCAIALTSAAPSGGVSVVVSSSSGAVKVPASVLIAAGTSKASLTADVSQVSSAQTATLTASAGGASKSVALKLNAAVEAFRVSAASLAFGNVAVGTSVSKSLTLTSTGTVPVTINSDSASGSGFSVSGGKFPATLNPGQAMVVTVQFSPGSAKQMTGQLTFSSTATAASVSLSGTGTSVTPTVTGLSCASRSFTGSASDSCKVTLSGSAPTGGVSVALGSSTSAVTVPASIMVPATATSVTFTASITAVSTTQSATLKATAGGISQSVSLQLNAAAAALTVNATSISFGNVILSKLGLQTLTLTSSGTLAVTVNSVSLTGSAFSITTVTLPATLQPGQKLSIGLTFDPTATGSTTGQLTIQSNSSTNSTLTVNLTGTGSPHQVILNWGAPTNSTDYIAGYNVYRASGTSGRFALMVLTPQTAYTDTTVQGGQTYAYQVTSVDSAGVESTPSNITTVTIP